jgi:hypothetical protein
MRHDVVKLDRLCDEYCGEEEELAGSEADDPGRETHVSRLDIFLVLR